MSLSAPSAAGGSAEDFRLELRAWLADNLDAEVRAVAGGAMAGDPRAVEVLRAWQRRLADAGFAGITWPLEHGGRAAGVLEQVAYAEEMDRARAPGDLNPIGMANIAPAIMAYGTEKQKRQLLPRMRRGDDIWCQGFSEPEAGSDLASVRTTAVRDGDVYVVNGQKLWTTLAHVADWCELLVRTDPAAPKHRGISCLLVDMTLSGISVRPLRTLTGDTEFNEVFFDDLRVPVDALLGQENDGWRVAMTTLNHERAGVLKLALAMRRKVSDLLDLARTTPRAAGSAADDPVVRQALARVHVEAEYLGLLADRAVADALVGRDAGPGASLGKLVWSELDSRITDAASLVLGPAAAGGTWGRSRVYSRALTLAGGTTQVNKNIVATRVLGLPRE